MEAFLKGAMGSPMIKVGCCGFPVRQELRKGSSYPEAYMMFNNTSMFDEACRFAKLIGAVDSREKG